MDKVIKVQRLLIKNQPTSFLILTERQYPEEPHPLLLIHRELNGLKVLLKSSYQKSNILKRFNKLRKQLLEHN